jgi:hypothetical protein
VKDKICAKKMGIGEIITHVRKREIKRKEYVECGERRCLEAVAILLATLVVKVFLVEDDAATLPTSASDKVVDAVEGTHGRTLGSQTRSGSVSGVDRDRL